MLIGCFEVEQLSRLRWRVTNTLTQIAHVTYGTDAEVREQLELQTAAWRRRFAKGEGRMTKGSFRGPMPAKRAAAQ